MTTPRREKAPDGYDITRCWATSARTGQQCGNWPMTDMHVCRIHGGSSRNAKRGAQTRKNERLALAAVNTYGLPRDIDPATALLEEVQRTAGHVAWLGDVIQALQQDELVFGVSEITERPLKEAGGMESTEIMVTETVRSVGVNTWLALYQTERRHLVQVSKVALDAGIDERRVRLAENQGTLLVAAIRQILAALGLTTEQTELAGTVVPSILRQYATQTPIPIGA